MMPLQAHEVRAMREAEIRSQQKQAEMAFWLRLERRCRQAFSARRLLLRLARRPQPVPAYCR
jgi:hypothetical protein